MDRLFYDQADLVVCDPVAANRATTRSALFALGYRRLEIVANLRDLIELFAQRCPDLVMCDTQVGVAELCGMVQELRQGIEISNPFMLVLVTAWSATPDAARQISDAGADDLLLRPFSTARLNERITSLTFQRKNFIVTSGYVGPERRSGPARPSNAMSFVPPNTLKTKAQAAPGGEELSSRIFAEVAEARAALHVEKLKRESIKLCAWARLIEKQRTADFDLDVRSELAVLAGTFDARGRAAGVPDWQNKYAAMARALAAIEESPDKLAIDSAWAAAMDLAAHFNADRDAKNLSREIDGALNLILEHQKLMRPAGLKIVNGTGT